MPARVHIVGVDRAHRQDVLLDLDDRDPRRHRHDRVEVALRAPEPEIARGVGLIGPDAGIVERQRVLQQVFAAVEKARLPAFGEFGADRRRGVEGRDPGTCRAHPLGERALRRELGLDQTLFDIFG